MDSQRLTAWRQLPLEAHTSYQAALLERDRTHTCADPVKAAQPEPTAGREGGSDG